MSSTFTPPGDGWIAGPLYPPDLEHGPIETVRRFVSQVGAEDVEQVWHRPLPPGPLPIRPGYYLAEHPTYAGGPIVVELLGGPDGEWVDAGDRGYLTDEQVAGLGRLQPLALVADVLDEVAEIEVTDPAAREEIREGLELIARRFGVPR